VIKGLLNSRPFIVESVKLAAYINPDDLSDNESPYYLPHPFDKNRNWLYNIDKSEQEQLAAFIIQAAASGLVRNGKAKFICTILSKRRVTQPLTGYHPTLIDAKQSTDLLKHFITILPWKQTMQKA
jgi:hypothetical protein